MTTTILATLLAFSSSALAGPAPVDMTDRQKALHRVVQIEVRTAEALHDGIGAAIQAGELEITAACKTANTDAKSKISVAKKHRDANEWRDAYRQFRAAVAAFDPACIDALAGQAAPAALKSDLKELMTKSHAHVASVRDYIQEAANPKANEYHAAAVKHHEAMKAHIEKKERKAAIKAWFATMRDLEKAIHTADPS